MQGLSELTPAPKLSPERVRRPAKSLPCLASAAASQVLPPGAAQLQPLVETLFVLADVRTQVEPKPAAGAAAGAAA